MVSVSEMDADGGEAFFSSSPSCGFKVVSMVVDEAGGVVRCRMCRRGESEVRVSHCALEIHCKDSGIGVRVLSGRSKNERMNTDATSGEMR